MLKRILIGAVAGVSLLLGGAHAPAAQAASTLGYIAPPTGGSKADTKPAGVVARKGMPNKAGIHTLTTCGVSGGCFHYVTGRQVISSVGITAGAWMANPFLKTTAPADAHSLQELALESADSNQIVEVGWTRDPAVCGAGSTTTCFFTYAWVNNTQKCYNGCGYVDLAANSFNAGDAFPAADMGTVKTFTIFHGGSPSGFYVGYNGSYVGYWPDNVWSGATPAVTFTQGDFFQVFGEVAGNSTSNWPPCSDMGTGIQGSLGQSNVPKPSSWSSTTLSGVASTSINLTLNNTYPTGYTNSFTGSATNVRSFSLGGPGANAAGTGVGSTGSC